MQRVLINDLKVKPNKITKRQLLSDTIKKKRYERSKMLLNKLLDGTWPQVLWTDEKLFTDEYKMIRFGLNLKIQCQLNVELHSGGKISFGNGLGKGYVHRSQNPFDFY